jgi:hypothetical protein
VCEGEGVIELDALDVEFVQKIVFLLRWESGAFGAGDHYIEEMKGDAERVGDGCGIGWVELLLCVGEVHVDELEDGAEFSRRTGRERGDAGECGINAVEEARFEAG